MALKIVAASRDAKRLERDGVPVAMLLAYANRQWGLFDCDERPLTKTGYATPADAKRAFLQIEADKAAAR